MNLLSQHTYDRNAKYNKSKKYLWPQLKSAKREKWVRWLHLQTVSSELLSGGSTYRPSREISSLKKIQVDD